MTGLGGVIMRARPAKEVRPPGATAPVRLFESDFLERFTRTTVATILLFWVPLCTLCLVLGLHLGHFTAAGSVLIIVAGIIAWTLFEYSLHRFIFHLDRWLPAAQRFSFLMHGVHHVDPADAGRDIMPLMGSIPIFIVLVTAATVILGAPLALALFGAFGFAYLAYDLTHYACHQRRMTGRVGAYLKRHHLSHHYADGTRNFGVTSPLWDWCFGTLRRTQGATARRRSST
jgi:sterol desaturase/sphingolipid hydroxylase (fatty acid hydroxylase superfamily)